MPDGLREDEITTSSQSLRFLRISIISLLAVLPLGSGGFGDFAALSLLAMVAAPLVTNPAVPGVLTPLADTFAAATGFPLETVLMSQVVGYSNVVLPYHAAPVMVALTMGGVGFAAAAKATLTLTALTIVLILPLTYAWWRVLGLI